MDREQILEVIIHNMKLNVDGIEDTPIDPSKSMVEYGASSLDMVEITSASMRELKIKVPRTRFTELKNINDLVDLFLQVQQETSE